MSSCFKPSCVPERGTPPLLWAIHDRAAQALGVMPGQGTQLSLEYMLTCLQGWHGKKNKVAEFEVYFDS